MPRNDVRLPELALRDIRAHSARTNGSVSLFPAPGPLDWQHSEDQLETDDAGSAIPSSSFYGQRMVRSVLGTSIPRPTWMDSVADQRSPRLRAATSTPIGAQSSRFGTRSSKHKRSLVDRHNKRWWNRLAETSRHSAARGAQTARVTSASNSRGSADSGEWCHYLIERIEARAGVSQPAYAHDVPTAKHQPPAEYATLSDAPPAATSTRHKLAQRLKDPAAELDHTRSAAYAGAANAKVLSVNSSTSLANLLAATGESSSTYRHSKQKQKMIEKAFSTLHVDTLQTLPSYRRSRSKKTGVNSVASQMPPVYAPTPPATHENKHSHTQMRATSSDGSARRWGRERRASTMDVVNHQMQDRVVAMGLHERAGSTQPVAGAVHTGNSTQDVRLRVSEGRDVGSDDVVVGGWTGDRVVRWQRDRRYFSDLYRAHQRSRKREHRERTPLRKPSLSAAERERLELEERKKRIFELPKYSMDPVSAAHGFLAQTDIRALEKDTNYSRRELFIMYVRFKALCAMSSSPQGITKEVFKRGVARLSVEDSLFVDRVFNIVDDDGSGIIEWEEFLTAMSALEKGSRDIKIQFCFEAYDLDQDTFIGKEDLTKMFVSSSMLHDDDVTKEVVETFVRKVFQTLNVGPNEKGISEQHVHEFFRQRDRAREEAIQRGEYPPEDHMDVWDLFGRSMLSDFSKRDSDTH